MIFDCYEDVLDIMYGCHPDYEGERLPIAVVKQATLHKPSDPTVDGSAIYIGVEWVLWELRDEGGIWDDDPEVRERDVAQGIVGTHFLLARGEIGQ